MAVLTPQQRRRRRQVERVIRLMAPMLDAVLFVGERVSQVAGEREAIAPPPPRRALNAQRRSPIGGPPA